YTKIDRLLRKGLDRFGVKVLGVIPHEKLLTYPSISELAEDLDMEILYSKKDSLQNVVRKFVIGDMQPHNALDAFTENTLLIVPGNREGLILTALIGNMLENNVVYYVSGIVFTNGIRPHQKLLDLIYRTNIPLLLVEEDSFTIASKINSTIFKVRAEDSEKISRIKSLIEEYVDIEYICNQI
ncbi:MAG: hypothetical protein HRT90_04465, partial [Candidatus Margulisbacteria bacterium]|nr:hypothetical protein [Candidatus Margulisiibacteriota bacterium]